jgi:hypothetical protein
MIDINLDSTALGSAGCILNLHRTVVDGYTEPIRDAKLIYGVAIHKYIDMMYKTKGHIPTARAEAKLAFSVPKADFRGKSPHLMDENHMIGTAFGTWEMYVKPDTEFELVELNLPCWKCKGSGSVSNPLGGELQTNQVCSVCNGQKSCLQPASEVTFRILYYQDDIVRIYLCGTIDNIGKIKGGCYAIRDFKTTSTWSKKEYFSQYERARQLRIYTISLKLMAALEPDSILGQIGKTNTGVFIDAIFIKPSLSDTSYGRSSVFTYRDSDLDAFRLTLDDQCKRLSQAIKTGYLPQEGLVNGACTGQWGKCKFWNVCNSSEDIAKVLLARDFKQKPFSPLNYNEV